MFCLLQHFHDVAYQADSRQDLLTAIDLFLDCSIVLPPSEIGTDELLRSVAGFRKEILQKREQEQSSTKLREKQSGAPQDEGEAASSHRKFC